MKTISPGFQRLQANLDAEAMRLRTLAEQQKALREVRGVTDERPFQKRNTEIYRDFLSTLRGK